MKNHLFSFRLFIYAQIIATPTPSKIHGTAEVIKSITDCVITISVIDKISARIIVTQPTIIILRLLFTVCVKL